MTEDKPDREPPEEDVQTSIDPNEAAAAVRDVNEAMAILPKKRLGCIVRFAKYGVVLLVLLAVFVYWNFLRTPRLKISKATTYITELTSDGTRVDYIAAFERDFYPPEMKTDDNGYRLIIRELGAVADDGQDEARTAQVYEKLGLDPATEPTLTCIGTQEFLHEYCATEGLDEKQADKLDVKLCEPWTLDDLPMMQPWLEESGPVLDLVGEAVRRPAYCFPMLRMSPVGTIALGEVQRTRSFARMLVARANYRIGIGDLDGAIHDVITCKRLGRHVQHQGMLVARLLGIAVESIADSFGVAAIRESQPTEGQLQRFADEIISLPPRPDMERTRLAGRYDTLASLQAMALGEESLAWLFSAWESIPEFEPGIAAYTTIDWNIVMRRANAQYDDLENIHVMHVLHPPTRLSLGNLFIGTRSRRVADLIIGLSAPAFRATREANRRSNCVDNLHRITLAMLIYEREHGTLPPAYTVDADGNPLHSWRVLLLPYLGEEELYDKLRLDEPWDSEYNRRFHNAALATYQCPSAELKPGQTTYSVVVGENTAFQAGEGKSLDDFGMNLILVVEREQSLDSDGLRQSVCWMDPTSELAESIAFGGINRREEGVDGIGSHHPGGVFGLRNGGVRFIPGTIELPTLQGLLDGTAEKCP